MNLTQIGGYSVYQSQSSWAARKSSDGKTSEVKGDYKTRQAEAFAVSKKSDVQSQDKVELSKGAQDLLEELKDKYNNMDFVVAEYNSDEEAQEYLSRGTKEYTALIDPDTLEKMAADKATKDKYTGIIDDATGQLKSISEKLGDDGAEVKRLGMSVGEDGSGKFFAEMEKMTEQQKAHYAAQKDAAKERKEVAAKEAKEASAEKAAEKKAEEAKAEKEAREADEGSSIDALRLNRTFSKEPAKRTTLYADTAEDLMNQIKNLDWSKVGTSFNGGEGIKIDFNA